ncbi:arginine--tRNA ligase [Legionella taurinensis]|uniref:Arginine--tRNA ligase n=1 Tax=Legionella taurinensis TaxID=70611 RepID=A0A3A5L7B3_9GAMM|nr:arginine--tRNA ligase [Legionella taurinensis]MDX1836391.1 arginine--tRNA ligase [Legionella taurinensis]PUT43137.1 arginine--tRNA ligase [Legionella taurinensis]PUT45046.1 arginine--tRNA ligase [Legionella taurinensis]PUT45692.1 arginine--tRNA ligase [Legionella taurinensis]PUT49461.1 arginine--tRNA ligase [Legionella taurinensis]
MKETVENWLASAIATLKHAAVIPADVDVEIKIERTKDAAHGDFATNLAMMLAKPCRQSPRQLAELIIAHLPKEPALERVEIAGPGFINFFMKSDALSQVIGEVLKQGEAYGSSDLGQGKQVLIEFVSANPTGPLHVGHGRGAAFGATLANLLTVAGYDVSREYYVNDAGRQMNILAVSVWLRYLSLAGETIVFPANGYRGEYVNEIAEQALGDYGMTYCQAWSQVSQGLPPDEPEGGDKEIYIDAIIERARELIGEEGFKHFHQLALNSVLCDIKSDLAEFGVRFDCWFSEQSLLDDGAINKGIEALKAGGHTYLQDGALWFKATAFGDEKDRVLIRANGQTTYFASDVAYHWNKYDRGFDRVIDIFGADHHGYVTRVRAAVNALGHDEDALNVLLVQFAILYRGGERVQMSTRSGSFVTLRELRDEVGNDAARFFYVMRKPEQHMDFDLDLAKSQSSDNPVYYIQYAHARISSVLRQLRERGLSWDEAMGLSHVNVLQETHEQALMTMIGRYPEVIKAAAGSCEPHQVAYYLRELANNLHSYYNAVQLLCEDEVQRAARLCLLKAVRQVLRNGLHLLGVSSPESM